MRSAEQLHGAGAEIVSNHGGRQLDGAVAFIRVLPGIADSVTSSIPVLIDGGFRRAVDEGTRARRPRGDVRPPAGEEGVTRVSVARSIACSGSRLGRRRQSSTGTYSAYS
jgi:hypothetical protein